VVGGLVATAPKDQGESSESEKCGRGRFGDGGDYDVVDPVGCFPSVSVAIGCDFQGDCVSDESSIGVIVAQRKGFVFDETCARCWKTVSLGSEGDSIGNIPNFDINGSG
jgi:hypothetical protein